jgi:beta-glucosidase
MKSQLLTLCLIVGASAFGAETTPPLYLDANQAVEKRVEDLLSRLTLEEKDSLVYANSTFSTAGVPRLGIPELWTDDGPMGVREEVGVGFRNLNRADDFATAMPATLGLAATFNTELARAYGTVIGQEAKQRGKYSTHAVVRSQF